MIEGQDSRDIQHNVDYLMNNKKQYISGTAYNGVTITVTGVNFTLTRGVFIPYKTVDDTWRLRFNLFGTIDQQGVVGSMTLTIAGVTFKNVAGYRQACSAWGVGATDNLACAVAVNNTGTILVDSHGDMSGMSVSGDVELDTRPTWADSWMRQ